MKKIGRRCSTKNEQASKYIVFQNIAIILLPIRSYNNETVDRCGTYGTIKTRDYTIYSSWNKSSRTIFNNRNNSTLVYLNTIIQKLCGR